jgi:hypothetical protein
MGDEKRGRGRPKGGQGGKVVQVRGVDSELHKFFHARAIERGLTIGKAFNEAVRLWLEQTDKPK